MRNQIVHIAERASREAELKKYILENVVWDGGIFFEFEVFSGCLVRISPGKLGADKAENGQLFDKSLATLRDIFYKHLGKLRRSGVSKLNNSRRATKPAHAE